MPANPAHQPLPIDRTLIIQGGLNPWLAVNVHDRIASLAEQDPAAPIHVMVSLAEGRLDQALDVHRILAASPCPLYTYAMGTNGLVGVLILLSAPPERRLMQENAWLRADEAIHTSRGGTLAEAGDKLRQAREVEDEIVAVMTSSTGMSPGRVRRMLRTNRWYNRSEAAQFGLISHDVVPPSATMPADAQLA